MAMEAMAEDMETRTGAMEVMEVDGVLAMEAMAEDMETRTEAMEVMEVDGVLATEVELVARCVAVPGVHQGAAAGAVAAHTRVSSRTSQSCTNAVTCHAQILLWRVTM